MTIRLPSQSETDCGSSDRPLVDGLTGLDVQVFTMPSNGPHIAQVLRAGGLPEVTDCGSLEEAVGAAFVWAQPDGVVLLSPAAASFDLFKDYRTRGSAFAAAAEGLRPDLLTSPSVSGQDVARRRAPSFVNAESKCDTTIAPPVPSMLSS